MDEKFEQIVKDVTAWLLNELKKGQPPWVHSWTGLSVRMGGRIYPITGWSSNIRSPRQYYGTFNHYFLKLQRQNRSDSFTSNFWITPAAIKELEIGKPEDDPYRMVISFSSDTHGSPVVFREIYHVEQVKDCEKSIGFSFVEFPDRKLNYTSPKRAYENLKENCGLEVVHGQPLAAFNGRNDRVYMPSVGQFIDKWGDDEGESHYWATMWHEVVHWTGHSTRLDRHTRSTEYAFEELVAESGAAYLCANFGIEGKLQHAQYIDYWLRYFGDEGNKSLFNALAKAQESVKWILSNSRSRKSENTPRREESWFNLTRF